MKVYKQPLLHATSVTFSHGPGPVFLVKPAESSIGFGVVLFATVSSPHELCLVNRTAHGIDVELSFTGDSTSAFVFAGYLKSKTVQIPSMESAAVEVSLSDVLEEGALEACLVVHASHAKNSQTGVDPVVFEIPVRADIQRVGVSFGGCSEIDGVLHVDLGIVPCESTRTREVTIENLCGTFFRVQAQVQRTSSRSKLSVGFKHDVDSTSAAQLHSRGKTTLTLVLEGHEVAEEFEGHVLVAFLSEENLKFIHVRARVLDHNFKVLCEGQKLAGNGELDFGFLEVDQDARKWLELCNTGELDLDFTAVTTGSENVSINAKKGLLRPGESLRVLVSVKSPRRERTLAASLKLAFNKKQPWSLRIKAEFGTRRVEILGASKTVKLKLGAAGEPLRVNQILQETIQTIKFRNYGTLPVEVRLPKNSRFEACDDGGVKIIEAGKTLDFKVQLRALPAVLKSAEVKMVFRTNSRDEKYATLEQDCKIVIDKAGLEVKPYGCLDLGQVHAGRTMDFTGRRIEVQNAGPDPDMKISIAVSQVVGRSSGVRFQLKVKNDVWDLSRKIKIKKGLAHSTCFEPCLEVDADFEGDVAFEVCITAPTDLVLAPGSATELQPQVHRLLVLARVVGSESATLAGPQTQACLPRFELLQPACVQQIFMADYFNEETVCPAALAVCVCKHGAAFSSVLPSLSGSPSAFEKAREEFGEDSPESSCIRIFSSLVGSDRGAGETLTVAQLSNGFENFDAAEQFKGTWSGLERRLALVLEEGSPAGALVHQCCKIVSRQGLWGSSASSAATGLLSLFDEQGKVTEVENLLSSFAFAYPQRSSTKGLPGLLLAVGKLQTQGGSLHILEAAAPEFVRNQSALSTAQRIVAQDAMSVLCACRDVLLEGLPESEKWKAVVTLIGDVAQHRSVELKDVVLAPFFMAMNIRTTGLLANSQKRTFLANFQAGLQPLLLTTRTSLSFIAMQDKVAFQMEGVNVVMLILSECESSGGKLADLETLRVVLIRTSPISRRCFRLF